MSTASSKFRIRSYVPRGRRTAAQEKAYAMLWPQAGLKREDGRLNYAQSFGAEADCFLEIGFGSGQSLLALAAAEPHHHFIGIETHQPGIGALLMGMAERGVTNLRVYYDDAIDVLTECIPNHSLAGIQIFFPDPWPKRRHHQRRLIQPDFLQLVHHKLKPGGELHLATDWAHYAQHMMTTVSAMSCFKNLAGNGQFANRSTRRPIVTKFESRAIREGRGIWEIQLAALAR